MWNRCLSMLCWTFLALGIVRLLFVCAKWAASWKFGERKCQCVTCDIVIFLNERWSWNRCAKFLWLFWRILFRTLQFVIDFIALLFSAVIISRSGDTNTWCLNESRIPSLYLFASCQKFYLVFFHLASCTSTHIWRQYYGHEWGFCHHD